jgi:uncharacterized RDD family membrane protein YckC
MYCSRCGAAVADNASFCGHCGQPLNPVPPEPVGVSPVPAPVFAAPGIAVGAPPITPPATALPASYPAANVPLVHPYAGFWLRLVAYLIDSAVLVVGVGAFVVIGALTVGAGFFRKIGDEMSNGDNVLASLGVLFILLIALAALAATWIYYAWFESSTHQATLGKLALGLIVTDMQGRRITFARASGRFFAKIVTGLVPLFIGYIMAGFTEKKQALHDMIAGCLVLRKL